MSKVKKTIGEVNFWISMILEAFLIVVFFAFLIGAENMTQRILMPFASELGALAVLYTCCAIDDWSKK